MSQLHYSLNDYIKVVEFHVQRKHFDHVNFFPTKGSIFRFELYMKDESSPCSMWVIHHEHNKKKEIWSKEDYRKAADRLDITYDEFINTFNLI